MELTMKMVFAAALIFLAPMTAEAEDGDVRLGFIFARQHCSICHAILKTGESPQKLAPPFRELHLRYPVEELGEALGEGIRTGHPMMPEFQLDPDQIENLLAYLKSLER
jgi:cytochrome c